MRAAYDLIIAVTLSALWFCHVCVNENDLCSVCSLRSRTSEQGKEEPKLSLSTEEVHFCRAERSRCSAALRSGKTDAEKRREKTMKQRVKPAGPVWIRISVTEEQKENQQLPETLSEELMWSF